MTAGPALDPYTVLQVVPTAEQEVVHAAYRALALKYHPDRDATRRAAEKMAALNRAYAVLRDERTRASFDRTREASVVGMPPMRRSAGTPHAPPAVASPGSVLGFGRYSGWSLPDLARRDPEYLLWLSRHSSGIRYRTEIYGILRTMGVAAA
jgi:curved DNA-binding protein CbpA